MYVIFFNGILFCLKETKGLHFKLIEVSEKKNTYLISLM